MGATLEELLSAVRAFVAQHNYNEAASRSSIAKTTLHRLLNPQAGKTTDLQAIANFLPGLVRLADTARTTDEWFRLIALEEFAKYQARGDQSSEKLSNNVFTMESRERHVKTGSMPLMATQVESWDDYLSRVCGNGGNGVDSICVIGYNTVSEKCHIIIPVSFEHCIAERRPTVDDEDEVKASIEAALIAELQPMAKQVTSPKFLNEPVVVPLLDYQVAFVQIQPENRKEGHDPQHGLIEVFAYIDLVVDDDLALLKATPARINPKVSLAYRQRFGVNHKNQPAKKKL